ncbi:MAG: bifunctional hydroxymethylpyrimidine kinase/phosphomethylpyrimidine kinase [Cyanobacteria bacterium P01_H01_bin.119]
MTNVPTALTVAGSDSGGGAGIQADLKTFAFHRVHGMSAITCVTAQNTQGVDRVDPLSPESVRAQINAVVDDIGVQAVKTGMLLAAPIIKVVAEEFRELKPTAIIVDPVMVSRSGVQLIDDDAIATLRTDLIPQATILTPNRYEAQILSDMEIDSLAAMEAAAQRIYQLGPKAVLVKGGAMADQLRGVDVWYDGDHLTTLRTETVETRDTHGTGCTLSAAIAANLALGKEPLAATEAGKGYVTEALKHSLRIGQGQGPVGHFYPILS